MKLEDKWFRPAACYLIKVKGLTQERVRAGQADNEFRGPSNVLKRPEATRTAQEEDEDVRREVHKMSRRPSISRNKTKLRILRPNSVQNWRSLARQPEGFFMRTWD